MQLQIRILVHHQSSGRRERNGAIERLEPLSVQHAVVIEPPPSLAVVAVRDVELRPRIALGSVGTREREASLGKLIVAEKTQPVRERLLVDPVGADRGGKPACYLC